MWVWAAGAVAIVCFLGIVRWFLAHEYVMCKHCYRHFWYSRKAYKWFDPSRRVVSYRLDGEMAYPSVVYTEAVLTTNCPACKKLLISKREMWMPESMAVELKEPILAQKCSQCDGLGYLEVTNLSLDEEISALAKGKPRIKCVACSGMGVFKIKDN